MEQTKTIAFALLRYALCKEEIPTFVRESITRERLERVYSLLKAHDLAHLGYDGVCLLNNEEVEKTGVYQAFKQQQQLAVYRYEQKKYEYEQICLVFEQAQIPYLPLKGAVISAYYPQEWMRTSCDIDILVEKENVEHAVAVLTKKLKYALIKKDAHEISLFAENGVHLELHFQLEDARVSRRGEEILKNIWQFSQEREGCSYQRKLTDEAFYFYHVAHMAKHFELGGCGIRPFIDLWVLNNKVQFDKDKREILLKENGLLRFAIVAQKLSGVWFSKLAHDEYTKKMQDYLLRGGVYGNMENAIMVQQVRNKGSFGYLLSRIFVSYEKLVVLYPSLEKHKWLFLFYQIRRWFRLLFKSKRKSVLKELQVGVSVSKDQKTEMEKLLKDLEL